MPATVIDRLVVSLGLDTTEFDKGSAHAVQQFKTTGESAHRVAKEMEEKGKVAAEFFSKIKEQALGLMAVLIGGHGLEEIVRDTVTSLAALGRAAQNIGVAVPELAAFRNIIEANGGSADEAQGSFQRLADSMAELKATGTTAILPGLQMIGGVRGENAMQTYMRFVEFAAQHKNDIGLTRLVGHRLGLDEGSINEALKGTVQVAKDLADATKRGVPTEEMTENARALQSAWFGLKQAATALTDELVDHFAPALTGILNTITAFIQEHPNLATAAGLGLGAAGTVGGLALGRWLLRSLLGTAGSAAGAAAQTAAGASLTGAAAALVGAAEALTAAAAALGAGGVAGGAAKAAAQAVGAGAGASGLKATGRLPISGAPAAGGLLARLGLGALRVAGPIAAFVAGMWPSSTQTQEQENAAMGHGPIGVDSATAPTNAPASLSLSPQQYDAFRTSISNIESRGRYDIMGGSSGRFAGKYQLGAAEIAETARALKEAVPSRDAFLHDPAMQERYFAQYTLAHHKTLMNNARYAAMTPEQRAAVLAYAHNQGAGGASRWLNTGQAGSDAFGTSGTAYSKAVTTALQGNVQLAQRVSRQAGAASAINLQQQAQSANRQMASNDNGSSGQNVAINGPIIIHTQATDAPGIARALRGELSGQRKLAAQANTGLA